MFPIGYDDSTRRTVPVVTYVLIAINLLFFFVELSGGETFIEHWSVVPRRLIANPGGDFPTIFTSMFMHAGWLHLLGNMLYLWIFGDNVEDNFGHLKFFIFYLICGLVASFSQIFLDPNSTVPSLGASGAIAGVLGAYVVMFPKNRVHSLLPLGFLWTTVNVPAWVMIGLWIVLQFFSQVASISSHTAQTRGGGVAYMAHIGGFVAGIILVFLFRNRQREFVRYDDR